MTIHAQAQTTSRPQRFIADLMAGLIVGLLSVAVSVSLAVLVFPGEMGPLLARGIGLALISTVLIGTAVAVFSSLPGAVATMQDAPAAILAVSALGIAAAMPSAASDEATFMTVIATIMLTTLAVALMLLAVGTFRLGRLVHFLPYPVVGGFLAGTGWLLFSGGLGVMTGLQPSRSYLSELFAQGQVERWLPGVALALVILVVTSRIDHYLVWPALLLGATLLFFAVLFLGGNSLAEWRGRGLLLGPFPATNLLQPIDYRALALVHWDLVARQATGGATVVFICLMSLLFNASGLELATGRKIDLNRELRAAGLGNLVTGILGGMPGYHVLSFSALNYRAGSGSRLSALTAVAVIVTTMLFGTSLLDVIPTMIVGGVLVYLGLSFLIEWVYHAAFRLPRLEYAVVLLILLVIATRGILQGVGVGVVAAVFLFAIAYSRSEMVKHEFSGSSYRSRVKRDVRERNALQTHGDRLLILQLQGFLFFGTAHTLLERIEQRLDRSTPIRYLLLDFRQVTGLDATALMRFGTLARLAAQRGFTLMLSDLAPTVRRQLEHGGVLQRSAVREFPSLDAGLEWAEEALLHEVTAMSSPGGHRARLEALPSGGEAATELLEHFERLELAPGHVLLRQGDDADTLFFVESGQVTARLETEGQPSVRLETMRGGSIVGELGFLLGGVRTASVVVDEASVVHRMSREELAQLQRSNPAAAARFYRLLGQLLSERVVHLVRVVDALQR